MKRHKKAEEDGERMAKTKETTKALSCRNSHQSNKLQVITEALLAPFYSVFPLTVIYFMYNRPHSRQDIELAINKKLSFLMMIHSH